VNKEDEEKAARAFAEVIEALDYFESTGDRSKFIAWSEKYGQWIREKLKEKGFRSPCEDLKSRSLIKLNMN